MLVAETANSRLISQAPRPLPLDHPAHDLPPALTITADDHC